MDSFIPIDSPMAHRQSIKRFERTQNLSPKDSWQENRDDGQPWIVEEVLVNTRIVLSGQGRSSMNWDKIKL
jgi:hypothetical protein